MAIIYLVFIYFYNFDREGLGEFDVHILYVNVRWFVRNIPRRSLYSSS